MKEESFLEYINQLVMTGEVAGLFPKEEMDALLNDVRGVFKKESPGERAADLPKFLSDLHIQISLLLVRYTAIA